jgi:amino acid transporter
MPAWLGKVHPRYATPYAALIVHASVSVILVIINFSFTGAGVQETFQKLLSLAVVLQLVPFLYIFTALLKIVFGGSFVRSRYSRSTLVFAGVSGLVTTMVGIALAFFPAQQITSLVSYEIWMFGGTLLFLGLAAFFFFVYGRRKATRKLEAVAPVS